MSSNFPVDDEGNWLSLPSDDGPNQHQASTKRIWRRANLIAQSFIDQVAALAPLRRN